jgi:hypothetical protein
MSGLRAAQLSLGCTPRVIRSAKVAVTAQQEVAEMVRRRHVPAHPAEQELQAFEPVT